MEHGEGNMTRKFKQMERTERSGRMTDVLVITEKSCYWSFNEVLGVDVKSESKLEVMKWGNPR